MDVNVSHFSFVLFPQVCGGDLPYVSPDSLEEKHHFNFKEALYTFSSTKKMGGQEFCNRYQAQLDKELEEMWQSFCKHNEVKRLHNSICFWCLEIVSMCFFFPPSLRSLKISSAPSGHLRCSSSSSVFSTCCLACCSSSASPPLPWCVIALWVWSWCPCWRGPSSVTLANTEALVGPSTKRQVSSWSRWV